ncbi:MAG: competence protein ComEC, partial [Hyphomicrobiales bacterium]
MPVGEGAIRVRTGRSDIKLEAVGDGAAAPVPDMGAAPLSTWARWRPSLGRARPWIVDQVEAQADRWTLWTPVALGAGCAAYFGLLREPQAWVAWALLPLV